MSRWSGVHIRRSLRRNASEREREASDARHGDWTREDLVTLETGSGPMTLALEHGSRGGIPRLLIEHHRENGSPISMRFPGKHLAMLSAVLAMIVERES